MKRYFFLLILGFSALQAAAQPALSSPEYYIGGQAGVLASRVNFSPTVNQTVTKPLWGANAGVVFRYARHKYCGLQVELNYMQRGWREPSTETTEEYSRRLDYIEIPFMSHIYFGKKVRGYINLGPQIGYLIYDNFPPSTAGDEAVQQKQRTDNHFDWGVTAGIGMYARTKAGVWQIESRFNYSLGTIYSSRAGGYFNLSNHMNLSLNFAYLWQLQPKDRKKK